MNKNSLVRYLRAIGILKNRNIEKAFTAIDRADFVDEKYQSEVYEDYPLQIGFGQTISQPRVVAFMLELLEVSEGDKVLDVGTGSGWTTALLSVLVGEEGVVIGVEIIPELIMKGQENIQKAGVKNAKIIQAEEVLGNPDEAPYDRILVSASSQEIPEELISQLKNNGTMVCVVGYSILKITKGSQGNIIREDFPDFAFVPLVR